MLTRRRSPSLSPMPRRPKPAKSKNANDSEKRLAEALKREAEALEQQTATSEILRTIASSPTDIVSVLNAICETAARLTGSTIGAIWRVDGRVLRVLHFDPVRRAPRPVAAVPPLGDDALQAHAAGVRKHCLAVISMFIDVYTTTTITSQRTAVIDNHVNT